MNPKEIEDQIKGLLGLNLGGVPPGTLPVAIGAGGPRSGNRHSRYSRLVVHRGTVMVLTLFLFFFILKIYICNFSDVEAVSHDHYAGLRRWRPLCTISPGLTGTTWTA